MEHVDYPHEHGYLIDCAACESRCHCTPGNAECVYEGEHASWYIVADTREHAREGTVRNAVREAWPTREPISDACALTIASWWQSPGSVGAAMATLASTGSVDCTALLDDIGATMRTQPTAGIRNRQDFDALIALQTWAVAKASR
jgi:hypothetical protein